MSREYLWNIIQISGRACRILRRGNGGPVFFWAFFPHEGNEAENLQKALEELLPEGNYAIAAFQVEDWNRELSPWEAPAAFGTERFGGGASNTLRWLGDDYLPWIRGHYPDCGKFYTMGYSLAGLFSLWSLYETGCFDGAVCCSGSLWIDGWDAYVSKNRITSSADVYLSLGGREEKTKNAMMARVGDRTRQQERILRSDPRIRRCVLEWNAGGHFADSGKRLAKGVSWIISQQSNGKVRESVPGTDEE